MHPPPSCPVISLWPGLQLLKRPWVASAIAGRQAGRSVGTEPICRLCRTASPHGPRNEILRSYLLTGKEEEPSWGGHSAGQAFSRLPTFPPPLGALSRDQQFLVRPGRNYFKLCRPHGLCQIHSALSLQLKGRHVQYTNWSHSCASIKLIYRQFNIISCYCCLSHIIFE